MNRLKAMFNRFVGLFTSSTSIEHDAQIEGSEVSDEQTNCEKDAVSRNQSVITSKTDNVSFISNDKNSFESPARKIVEKVIQWTFGSDGYDKKIFWLIPYVIPLGANGLFIGDTGSFKTFMVLDWACRIAKSLTWDGYPINGGLVIYIAGEGETSLARRIRAWELLHGIEVGSNLVTIPQGLSPTDVNEMNVLIKQIEELCEEKKVQVKMIVFDTLSQCYRGKDENNAAEMSKYISACKELGNKLKATVLNVHHTGKNNSYRGSSALLGNVDFSLLTKRQAKLEFTTTLSITKSKDSDTETEFTTKLEKVDLGIVDEYDNPVTSLAVDKFEAKSSITEKEPTETKQVKDCKQIYQLAKGMLEKSDINTITKKGLSLAFSKHVDADPQDDRDYASNDFGRAFKRLNKLYSEKIHHDKDQDTLSLIN